MSPQQELFNVLILALSIANCGFLWGIISSLDRIETSLKEKKDKGIDILI